jgi:aspartate carbamoyltransferase regulatory subunit
MLQDKQHLDNKDSSIKSNTDQSVELSLYSDLGSLNSLINSMISSNKEYVKLELSKILSNSINPMSTYSSEAGINSLVSSSAVYKKVRS